MTNKIKGTLLGISAIAVCAITATINANPVEDVEYDCYITHGTGPNAVTYYEGRHYGHDMCDHIHNQAPDETIIVGNEVIEHVRNELHPSQKLEVDDCTVENVAVYRFSGFF